MRRTSFTLLIIFYGLLPRQLESSISPPALLKQQPTAYALLIGPTSIDIEKINTKFKTEVFYGGFDFVVPDMQNISSALEVAGFPKEQIYHLTGSMVNKAAVLQSLQLIREKSGANDLVFLYFSGHGDQIKDQFPIDEPDGLDEVLVLSDDYLVDDEVNVQLKLFNKHQRIIMVIDACHSGTSYKMIDLRTGQEKRAAARLNSLKAKSNKEFVDEYSKTQSFDFNSCSISNTGIQDGNLNMLYFGASSDDTEAKANSTGSYFTSAFAGKFRKFPPVWRSLSYPKLYCEVYDLVKVSSLSKQAVQYKEIGNVKNLSAEYPLKIK